MLLIGSHVSFNKTEQLLKSVREAVSFGANTFMFYTGAPQNTLRYKIDEELTKKAYDEMKENGIVFDKIIVHAPYIINLANRRDEEKWEFSKQFLKEELNRCSKLGCKYLVLHPGSHVQEGMEIGIKNIIDAINFVLSEDEGSVTILLETMSGKGSEIGSSLDSLKKIIDGIKNRERIGVCLDTCHLHDSGYDLTQFDEFLEEFDEKIGISNIKCVHINDSKNEKGSKKDRHENLGYGTIGFDTLLKIIYHEKLKSVPKILETPYINHEIAPYKKEMEMIKAKKFDSGWVEKLQEK